MDYYIKSLETIIKGESILRAKFTQEHTDDISNDEFAVTQHADTRLELVTSETVVEPIYGYEGDIRGVASASQTIVLHGSEAVQLWEALKLGAYQIIGEPS